MIGAQKPISKAQINSLEKLIGKLLPEDYSAFLIRYNCGYPEPNIFSYLYNGKRYQSDIAGLLGFDNEDEDNIIDYIENYKNRIPSGLLPIAYDSSGNLVCISLNPNTFGSIYFWDHENEYDDGVTPGYRNVYLIAHSFDEFLSGLRTS